jgi:hypothetical protein
VLTGKAGNGTVREEYLGDKYQLAQDGISKIDTIIKDFYNSFDDELCELIKMRMGIK